MLLPSRFFFHPFYNCKHSRAHGGIAQGKVKDLVHALAVRMGVLAAGRRAVVVHVAGIVGGQERARRTFEHVVAVFVHAQVLRNELRRLYVQGFGEAFDVPVIEDGTGGFAAVGALETVHAFKYFLVGLVEDVVYEAGIPFLEFVKEGFRAAFGFAR
jgi:hypothetical protein